MLERIKEIITDELGIDAEQVTESTSFKKDLEVDSLDLFQLVMRLEEEYGIEIPSDELEKMETVGQVMDYINKNK